MSSFIAQIVSPPESTPRVGERRKLQAIAQCRRGMTRETVEVLDLSPGGARVRALSPLRVGNALWIKIGTLEAREARIAWTRGFESGCEFVQPLHPAVYEALLAGRHG